VKRFEVIEHTADIGITAYGSDLKKAFANAAYALFSLMADLEGVDEAICYDVEVAADNQEDLIVRWLNELIYLFEVESIVFKTFRITSLRPTRLKAKCFGERFDPSRHRLKMGVKAATYHMVGIEKDDGYKVRVIFDV